MSRLFGAGTHLENTTAAYSTVPFTMAAWCYTTVAAATQTILSINDASAGADNAFRIILEAGGFAQARTTAAGSTASATSSVAWATNRWHHVAGLFNAENSRQVYLDGGGVGTNGSTLVPAGLTRTTVGRRASVSGTQAFTGRIAEAAIWSVALAAAELLALARGVSPLLVRYDALEAYWRIYGTASPEPDEIANTLPLTVTAATKDEHAPMARLPKRSFFTTQAVMVAPSVSIAALNQPVSQPTRRKLAIVSY